MTQTTTTDNRSPRLGRVRNTASILLAVLIFLGMAASPLIGAVIGGVIGGVAASVFALPANTIGVTAIVFGAIGCIPFWFLIRILETG